MWRERDITPGRLDWATAAETGTAETKSFIWAVNRITGRSFTAEEKIRIVLEGIRHEGAVREFCRREGIQPNAYYFSVKHFMEAGN